MTIADLLAASRSAHMRYRQLHATSKGQDLLGMGQAIQEALSARTEAHALNPKQTDPAWLSDQQANKGLTSEALLVFLAKCLSA